MTAGTAAAVRVGLAIPAAGSGRRMGGMRKAFLEIGGEPVLARALRPFLADPRVVALAVALAPEDVAAPPPWLAGIDPRVRLVEGGESRTDSVRRALAALPDELDLIAVHDAARPFVPPAVIRRCFELAAGGEGAVAGRPAVDTIKRVGPDGRIVETPDRASLWHAQTPQVFPAAVLRRAYAEPGAAGTDDAEMVEALGVPIVMVDAGARNLKVTHPEDVAIAEAMLSGSDRGSGDASR